MASLDSESLGAVDFHSPSISSWTIRKSSGRTFSRTICCAASVSTRL
uniref:Uncharacterized protein n=1 Tax=Pseudomonas phage KV2023 TaxID=3234047 RepID=A0AB39C6Q7_9CAUD